MSVSCPRRNYTPAGELRHTENTEKEEKIEVEV